MTREELLKKIDFEKSWLYDCGIFGSDVDIAFHAIKNSVIEALEQEPCEDATLKDIFCMGCEYKEQEQKTGHWIKLTDYHFSNISYMGECSECGDTVLIYIDAESEWKYCPNCGCHMVEQQESEVSK